MFHASQALGLSWKAWSKFPQIADFGPPESVSGRARDSVIVFLSKRLVMHPVDGSIFKRTYSFSRELAVVFIRGVVCAVCAAPRTKYVLYPREGTLVRARMRTRFVSLSCA